MIDWAMVWTTAGGVLTGGAGVAGAWENSRRRKRQDQIVRNEAHQQAITQQQATALDERSDILKQINEQLLGPLKDELKEVRERLQAAENKIDHLEDTNDHLVAFVYKLLGLARLHGYDKDIMPADVPPGIHL